LQEAIPDLAPERKTGRRRPLTPARIVDAAFDVIERDGLDAFSTRKLAQTLRCEAMSIYHYFPSKAHLLDAMIDRYIAKFELPRAEVPWRDKLTGLVAEWRRLAMAYPQFFRFFGMHRLNTPGGLKLLDWMLAVYHEAGFDPETAARLFRLTGYFVVGGLLDETSGYAKGPSAMNPPGDAEIARDYPRIAAAAPFFRQGTFEPTFDLGLKLLLDAFEGILVKKQGGDDKRRDRG
jgi:AcrR family transcriptional regulator